MVKTGQVAVATPGTAVRVSTNEAERLYVLKAHPGNTGNIAVGDSTVSVNTGLMLASTDNPITYFGKLSDLYLDAETAGDKLCWLVEL